MVVQGILLVSVCVRACVRACMRVPVCVCVCVCVCACMCMCVFTGSGTYLCSPSPSVTGPPQLLHSNHFGQLGLRRRDQSTEAQGRVW